MALSFGENINTEVDVHLTEEFQTAQIARPVFVLANIQLRLQTIVI